MSWVLDAVLNNTLFAAVMGMIVMAVSRFVRHQPAAIHAMWLIVLLKLITPPVVPVPAIVGWGFRDAVPFRAFQETPGRLPSALPMGTGAGDDRSRLHGALSSSDLVRTQSELQLPRGAGELQNEAGSEFRALVLGCWLIGTAVWTMVAAVRIFRFSRLLRVARPGSRDLVTVADRIAERLGLAKTPLIEVVDANIAPLVWHAGRTPRIVLPGEWVSRWTDEQIELVLAHEIAHVKRGDHWIRWFTLVVLAGYWWHPITWLAVRRLRVVEEQCCDAMVVASSPGSAHAYAETLLVTLDLLAARRSPPVLASGIDSGGSLKRRCEMILSDQTTFRMGRVAGLLLLLAAICILPLAVLVRAGDTYEKQKPTAQRQDAEQDQPKDDERSQIQNALKEFDKLLTPDGSIANWHKNPAWKAQDCLKCHVIEGREQHSKAVGKSLEEWDNAIKIYAKYVRFATRKAELEGARQGLRNLGFDDKLIEALVKDRVKAKSANQVIQNILRLTGESQVETEKDEARLLELFRSGRLRMPKHAMTAAERDKIIQYLLGEDHLAPDKDKADKE